MSFTPMTLKSSELAKELVDLADVLSATLTSKVSDTVREAITSEAQMWRTDAMQVLAELREDIRCRLENTDRVDTGARPTSKAMPLECSPTNSISSNISLPITTVRRQSSLEERLAADSFARAYSEPYELKGHTLGLGDCRPMHPSGSSNDPPKTRMFDLVVPGRSARVDHFPGGAIHEVDEEAPTLRQHQAAGNLHDEPILQHTCYGSSSQRKSLDFSASFGCYSTEDSRDINALGRDESLGMNSFLSSDSIPIRNQWKVKAAQFYAQRSSLPSQAWGPAKSIIFYLFRAVGITPWNVKRRLLSRTYQFAFLCCLILSTLGVTIDSFVSYLSAVGDHVFFGVIDGIVAVGTLLSFLAALWKNQALHDAIWLCESYLVRAGRLEEANNKACLDIAIMFFIWVLCVASRFYGRASLLSAIDFGFAFNALILTAMSVYASRVCRCLCSMVDQFCWYMQDNSNFEVALKEFFLLHCTIRTACDSLQMCFVGLQLCATVLFFFCSASIYFGRFTVEGVTGNLIPGILCNVVLLQLSIRAGFVSDLCARVPMLVYSANAKLEMQRMYVVDYIMNCQAGFYIFECRLTSAMLWKIFYITFVGSCSLLTGGLLQRLQ